MREAIKKREEIDNQPLKTNETPEVSDPPKDEHSTKIPELDTQETSTHKISNEVINEAIIVNQDIVNEITSINTIEAINMSASIKEEVPPLSN